MTYLKRFQNTILMTLLIRLFENLRRMLENNSNILFTIVGAWLLQDGAYSYHDFVAPFEEYEIQRVMRAYENSISINIHCCPEGEWTQDHLNGEQFSELCQVS